MTPSRPEGLSELPEGDARYFRYPGPEDQAVLVRMKGGALVASSQRCPHLSCAVVYQRAVQRLYCPCHEGVFDVGAGVPVAGLPRRPLTPIRLRVGAVPARRQAGLRLGRASRPERGGRGAR